MAFGRASGMPNYTSSGADFIPELWAPQIQVRFYESIAFTEICNTDYEGQIRKFGDTVNIRNYPDITVGSYVKGQDLDIQVPDSTPVQLLIDNGRYFNFLVDDVDEVQSDLNLLSNFSNTAAEQLKRKIDLAVLQGIYASADSNNMGATAGVDTDSNLGTSGAPLSLDKTNIVDLLVDAGTVLDEQDVPTEGRWMVIPPWAAGLISKSDLKDASLTGDGQSILRNGKIGNWNNFTLYISNQLYSVTDSTTSTKCFYLLAGQKYAVTFASQLSKVESLQAQNTFGRYVRGLEVFGYKVVKPTALVNIYADKA